MEFNKTMFLGLKLRRTQILATFRDYSLVSSLYTQGVQNVFPKFFFVYCGENI